MKRLAKLPILQIALFFYVFIIFYLYSIYNENYGYIKDFKNVAIEQGYSDLAYHGEYYHIYQDKLHYLILVKGNSNRYIVKKLEGLSQVDLIKFRIMELDSLSNISLEPSSLLVGNTRVKSLNDYLYWQFTNGEREVINIDYFRR